MESQLLHVRITFVSTALGGQPSRDIAEQFIGSKFVEGGGQLPDDEVATLDEMVEKGTTTFHKIDGKPLLYDYQVKGFMKEAARIFNGKLTGKDGKVIKNFRSKVANYVFVKPRQIELHLPEGTSITYNERPLQAQTAQGPRVALARSEEVPVGTWFECTLKIYDNPEIDHNVLGELMTYGEDQGIGQWRSGGHGSFTFEVLSNGKA